MSGGFSMRGLLTLQESRLQVDWSQQKTLREGSRGRNPFKEMRQTSVESDIETFVVEHEALEDALEVRATHIGKGIFAKRSYAADAIIGEILGEEIRETEYESDYCIWLGDDWHLEPAPPFRYLNHSCDANCEFDVFDVQEEGEGGEVVWVERVYLFAIRTIRQGEQLTIDYCWPADGAIPCACGAKNCRGWVVAEEELPLLRELQQG